MQRTPLTEAAARAICESVGLVLPPERLAPLAEAFNLMVLPALQAMDGCDVGEIQPQHTFDPRWKGGQA